jgi:hypothetical protein
MLSGGWNRFRLEKETRFIRDGSGTESATIISVVFYPLRNTPTNKGF